MGCKAILDHLTKGLFHVLLSPAIAIHRIRFSFRFGDRRGISIAFPVRSVDRSLFIPLILRCQDPYRRGFSIALTIRSLDRYSLP